MFLTKQFSVKVSPANKAPRVEWGALWRPTAMAAALALLSACGGGETGTDDVPADPTWSVESPTTSVLEAGGGAVSLSVKGGSGEALTWTLGSAVGTLISTSNGSALYTPPPAGSLSAETTVVITVRSAKGEVRTLSFTLRPDAPPTGWSLGAVADTTLKAGASGVAIPLVNNTAGRTITWSLSPAVGSLVDPGKSGVTYIPPGADTISASTRVQVLATDDLGVVRSLALTVEPVVTVNGFLNASNGVVIGEGGVPLSLALDVFDPGVTWTLTPKIGTIRTAQLKVGASTVVQGLYTPPTAGVLSKTETVTVVARKSNGETGSLAITVKPTQSLMSKRTWRTPSGLETDDRPVERFKAAIDDAGNLTVVFVKSNGTRDVLYAVRGTPNADGVEPTWSAPVPIDLSVSGTAVPPIGTVFNGFDSTPRKTLSEVAVAPNGDAYVAWLAAQRCTSTTYSTNTARDCAYLYGSKYSAASNTWSRAELLGSSPEVSGFGGPPKVMLNDAGDLAILYKGWVKRADTTTGYAEYPTILWRQNGSTAVRSRVFEDISVHDWFQYFDAGMDAAGRLVFGGQSYQNSTVDIVAYQGSVQDGFGSQQILDGRSAVATFEQMAVGPNGQALLLWTQPNGSGTRMTHAATGGTSGAWSVTELAANYTIDSSMVKDSGEVIVNVSKCSMLSWTKATGWATAKTLPDNCRSTVYGMNPNNDHLSIDSSTGRWSAYDAMENAMVQPIPLDAAAQLTTSGTPFYLGVTNRDSLTKGSGNSVVLLSRSKIGAVISRVDYDVMPRSGMTAGDGRSGVKNLWGMYFK